MKLRKVLAGIGSVIVLCLLAAAAFYSDRHGSGAKTSEISVLQIQMDELKSSLSAKDQRLEDFYAQNKSLEQQVSDIRKQIIYLGDSALRASEDLARMQQIIRKLPQLTKKLAFVEGIQEVNGTLVATLDYVEWFNGEEAAKAAKEDNVENAASLSNNFYIRNTAIDHARVEVPKDVLIYLLDGAMQKPASFQDFAGDAKGMRDKLIHFYFVGNQVVLLEEQYRP